MTGLESVRTFILSIPAVDDFRVDGTRHHRGCGTGQDKMRRNVRKPTFKHVRPAEDSDQPAHSRSLIRLFSGRNFDG